MLEDKLGAMKPITSLLDMQMTPADILNDVLGQAGLTILDEIPAAFKCNCDRKRVEKVLISLGNEELEKMAAEGESVEVKCSFCNRAYVFSPDEIKGFLKR